MSQVESKVEEMDKRLGEVEKKLGEQTSGFSGDTHVAFKPSYLEIKGFCDFNERLVKGVTRAEADSIVDKLKASFPEHAQGHVGAHVLRGPHNFSIKVSVHADSIREVLSKWRDYL